MAENEIKAFGYDFVQEKKKDARELSEGDYRYVVKGAYERECKARPEKGEPPHICIVVDVDILTDDPNVIGTSTIWCHFLQNRIGFLKSFLVNIGVMSKDDPFLGKYFQQNLVGKTGAAHFTLSAPKQSKDGFSEYRSNDVANFIDDFKPAENIAPAADSDDDCPF